MKKAFITGVSGQDGSYLSEFLLSKGYEVHGTIRRTSSFNTWRIDHILDDKNFFTHYSDLSDGSSLNRLLLDIKPDEIYNLAAQSHVGVSFSVPENTGDTTGLGALRILDVIRDQDLNSKYYQASTSELFGGFEKTGAQNEETPFTQDHHMLLQNFIRIGLLLTTEKPMVSLLQMEFFLTMSHQEEVKILLQEKLQLELRILLKVI